MKGKTLVNVVYTLFQKKNQSRTRDKSVSLRFFFFFFWLQMTENENQIDLSPKGNLLGEVYGLMYGPD